MSDDADDELQQLLQQFNSLESTETFETDPAAVAAGIRNTTSVHRHQFALQQLTSAALGMNNNTAGSLKRARRPSDPSGLLMTHGSGHLSPATAAAPGGAQSFGALNAGVSSGPDSRLDSGPKYNKATHRAASASGIPAGWRGAEDEYGGQLDGTNTNLPCCYDLRMLL